MANYFLGLLKSCIRSSSRKLGSGSLFSSLSKLYLIKSGIEESEDFLLSSKPVAITVIDISSL